MHELTIKYGVSDSEMEKNHKLKWQFRREHKKLKESNKRCFPLPFKVQLVWLPTVIIPTPRDRVERQSKHRSWRCRSRKWSYRHFF